MSLKYLKISENDAESEVMVIQEWVLYSPIITFNILYTVILFGRETRIQVCINYIYIFINQVQNLATSSCTVFHGFCHPLGNLQGYKNNRVSERCRSSIANAAKDPRWSLRIADGKEVKSRGKTSPSTSLSSSVEKTQMYIKFYWSLQRVTKSNFCTCIMLSESIGHYRCIRCHRWAGTCSVLSMCIQGHMCSSSCLLCWCSFPCPRRY